MTSQYLDYYTSANDDVNFGDFPCVEDNKIKMTVGIREILLQSKFQRMREINVEIDNQKTLENETLAKVTWEKKAYDKLENQHKEEVTDYENELHNTERELESKKLDLTQHKKLMNKYGVIQKSQQKDSTIVVPDLKENWISKINWKKNFKIVGFLLFELLIQYGSLRDFKSIPEIISRTVAITIVFLIFHATLDLNEKNKNPIYSFFMGFAILMILIMTLAPSVLQQIYPEQIRHIDSSTWSINSKVNLPTNTDAKEIPLWVSLYRKIDWAPALLVFIAYSMIPKNRAINDKINGENKELKIDTGIDAAAGLRNKLEELIKSVEDLSQKKTIWQLQIERIKKNSQDIIPIRDNLKIYKKDISEASKNIAKLMNEQKEIISKIEHEILLYKQVYLSIINSDETKWYILPKLYWPKIEEIINYYNIS